MPEGDDISRLSTPVPRPRPTSAPQTKFPPYKPPSGEDYEVATYGGFKPGLEMAHLTSQLAPEGLPTETYRRSENVEDQSPLGHIGSFIYSALRGAMGHPEVQLPEKPSVVASELAQGAGVSDIAKNMPNISFEANRWKFPGLLNAAQLRKDSSMMLPTVPQINPTQMFNSSTGPVPGGPPTGLGTPFSQQLLTLLGGLGGMPGNPLAPNIARPPQPGPPTSAATNILGALGATNP